MSKSGTRTYNAEIKAPWWMSKWESIKFKGEMNKDEIIVELKDFGSGEMLYGILSNFSAEPKTNPGNKPFLKLVGEDGNAFAILGRAMRVAKNNKMDWEKIRTEATSGDYDHLLQTMIKYFNVGGQKTNSNCKKCEGKGWIWLGRHQVDCPRCSKTPYKREPGPTLAKGSRMPKSRFSNPPLAFDIHVPPVPFENPKIRRKRKKYHGKKK